MSKCPKCQESWPSDHQCCPICGVALEAESEPSYINIGNANAVSGGVSSPEQSNVKMGNANAISGGIHTTDDHSKVDSDNETHINSHNTTQHITIVEAEKSESDRLKDNELAYRLKCQELYKDGLISAEGESQLRELQVKLNLADALVLPIKEEMRQRSKARKKQLSMTGMSDIRQTKSIIEQNTAPALQRQLAKLESWIQEYDDDALNLMYYQMSSMLEPVRYTNRYEDGAKCEYWESYWAYVAYMLQGREKPANEALASLGRWHSYYPEQNDAILLLTGRVMQDEAIADIQQLRDSITAHYTQDLQLLLDAVDELLQMDWSRENVTLRSTHTFYINTLFARFVQTQKAEGAQRLIERREQEKLIRAQQEQEMQAKQKAQNMVRFQKESLLQKYQEIGDIERACCEADVAIHTVNVWIEEDSAFASSYQLITHGIEDKRLKAEEDMRIAEERARVIHRKKSNFKMLYEQNDCDLLKTCSEVGVSTAEIQDWRCADELFNNDLTYIERQHKAVETQQSKQQRAKRVKRTAIFIGAAIMVVAIVLGTITIISNINEEKVAEEARIRQEEIAKEKIRSQQESLIAVYNNSLNAIENDIRRFVAQDPKDFAVNLANLEGALNDIKRFELENPSLENPQYEVIKQNLINVWPELDTLLLKDAVSKSTNTDNYDNKLSMKAEFEKLINRL